MSFSFCGVSKKEHEKLKSELENAKLENKNLTLKVDSLKNQLDSIMYGPERLLASAKKFITKKEYEEAKRDLELLIEKHPTSSETIEGEKLLTNVKSLIEKIKNEKELAEKQRLANSTKKLISSYDKIEKITWYKDRALHNSFAVLPRVYLYMGIKTGSYPWLRFVIQYYGDDWVFLNKYIIHVDGEKMVLIPPSQPNREVGSAGSVYETNDLLVTTEIEKIVKAIMNSNEAIIRFSGPDKAMDYTVSSLEKKALRNIIDGYVALGGKF
jgi:hypothetical protein